MDLVERYLHAIEFWLPKEQKRDIIAEISEDIHSQIEERREQLGRDLTEGDLEALVKERGAPFLVANRYLPQRSLIGPMLFPVYVFVLKIVAALYLGPALVVFITVHRVEHRLAPWSDTIGAAIGWLWSAAFVAAGVITLVFAVIEWSKGPRLFEKWCPRRLPAVRDANRIPRSSSIFELMIGGAFLIFWVNEAWSPDIFGLRIYFAPVWAWFFWSFVVLGVWNIALSALQLARPYWTGPRAAARLASDIGGSALFCWLMKAHAIAGLSIAGVDAARAAEFATAVNVWMDRVFPLAVIVSAVALTGDAVRLVRVMRRKPGQGSQVLSALTVL